MVKKIGFVLCVVIFLTLGVFIFRNFILFGRAVPRPIHEGDVFKISRIMEVEILNPEGIKAYGHYFDFIEKVETDCWSDTTVTVLGIRNMTYNGIYQAYALVKYANRRADKLASEITNIAPLKNDDFLELFLKPISSHFLFRCPSGAMFLIDYRTLSRWKILEQKTAKAAAQEERKTTELKEWVRTKLT